MVLLITQLAEKLINSLLLNNLLAQTVKDPDVLGQMQDAFNNFIESGQVWALLIGLFLGYMFRIFTAY